MGRGAWGHLAGLVIFNTIPQSVLEDNVTRAAWASDYFLLVLAFRTPWGQLQPHAGISALLSSCAEHSCLGGGIGLNSRKKTSSAMVF